MASEECKLTPAQIEHLRRLYAEFVRAQETLNDFAAYLLREYSLDPSEGWQLSPELDRFIKLEPNPTEPQDA